MSMLTPSGMGGKYRITGDHYPRMRRPKRRGRIVAVVIASVVVLGLFGYGALQLFDVFKGDDGDTKANAAPQSHPCTASPAPALKPMALPQPAAVTMNVYNATTRGGLAKTTADEFAKRGFKVKSFGNASAPYDKKVTQTALIVAGPAAEAAAREAGTQIAGSAVKIDPARKDKNVDVMIGNAYKAMASPADAAKARVAAANPPPPAPACGSSASASPAKPSARAGR
ncbi:LytR C-terminal domain-containing protein [Streptomyces sp. NRRL F-5123]|uniref:LytR C-terminal domain-containing protein n=1 Tax=Streptomyces sp. NRRL F-5123 TaxID=1463856 RepID=UPI0006947EBF|nr:LytR C-terminal domain-containing protein [Streptomyces sp. NRRL F-5123]